MVTVLARRQAEWARVRSGEICKRQRNVVRYTDMRYAIWYNSDILMCFCSLLGTVVLLAFWTVFLSSRANDICLWRGNKET